MLSMARRRSDDEDEERNLYGTSMESDITTDGEGGGETAGEEGGANRTHDGERFEFFFFQHLKFFIILLQCDPLNFGKGRRLLASIKI